MSLVEEKTENIAKGVQIVTALQALSHIRDPACAAAIWQRPADLQFQPWIDGLDPECLPEARVIVRPENMGEAVNRICDSSGTPDCPQRQWLVEDVASLAEMFAALMSAPYLRLRFDITKTNACRKFHMDYLTARLVCTYRGSGTQYGNSANGLDPQHIFSVPKGSPMVMRGQMWRNSPDTFLRHRSPPIEGTGETRLVLVFDPLNEINEEDDLASFA